MLEFHCVYNTIFAACPVAVSIALSHLLWCDSMSSADHTHLPLHWVGAGSQLRLPQATGPCCAQVKQVIGFPTYALPPPLPPHTTGIALVIIFPLQSFANSSDLEKRII